MEYHVGLLRQGLYRYVYGGERRGGVDGHGAAAGEGGSRLGQRFKLRLERLGERLANESQAVPEGGAQRGEQGGVVQLHRGGGVQGGEALHGAGAAGDRGFAVSSAGAKPGKP